MSELVLAERDAGVLLLTWNRPERRNAWTLELEEAYFDELAEAAADPEVRVIVVTGSGETFCPGLDMEVLSQGGANMSFPRRPQTFPTMIPKPMIAAINGACAGLGLIQALTCDVRFATRTAKITTAFSRRGIMAEHGIAWLLPRIVGHANATDLLLSGRVISGEEAHELGLVNWVTEGGETLERALAYARDIAEHCSPTAMATMKTQLYRDPQGTLEHSRLGAIAHWAALRDHPDAQEGVASFREKRPPKFAPFTTTVAESRLFPAPD